MKDYIEEAVNEAAADGRLDILIDFHRIYKNKCYWYEKTCSIAAEYGHLDCLKYLYVNGCPWDGWTCYYAALNGHLECLKYAHENGCPWSIGTCFSAANKGHLECLKYAHENGCLWDNETCYFAAVNGHLDCLEYAHKNGCPYPKYLLKFIIKKILIPKWRASVKIRPYAIYWMERSAQTSCAENGRARIEDINSFENDFNNLIV